MPKFFRFALSVRCPRCQCGAGHWCRDEQGKCIHRIVREPRRHSESVAQY